MNIVEACRLGSARDILESVRSADPGMTEDAGFHMLTSVIPAILWKRDNQGRPVNPHFLDWELRLPCLLRIIDDASVVPGELKAGVRDYLLGLPGAHQEGGRPVLDPDSERQHNINHLMALRGINRAALIR